jgi:Tol biopolymer transport system component
MSGEPPPPRLTAALEDRYRIERELGEGGMATVYLAEDLRHQRQVAIKVLKPELAAVLGGERFVQEITTTAQLQHPHILPLFDSGTADGFLFYVMPYVEGETLRDKLDRETQLGVDEAVRITREVADALDYAHRRGVIHRDIKPENILLHDGRPMVADFGIALAVSAAAGGRMTETGMSLGTPYYMSPEQATADKQITGRADIHSLASVLYEMLTGEPPHTGSSAQAVIMKIIAETPRPVSELRKSVPPNVAAAVMMALEKLPADRFETARAFADALTDPGFTTMTTASGGTAGGGLRLLGRELSWRSLALALAVVVIAQAFGSLAMRRRNDVTAPVARAEIDLASLADSTVYLGGADLSPDGSTIVFATSEGWYSLRPRLYLRRLDDRAAHVIPGTEGAREPLFSPDGQSIVFRLGDTDVRRIPAAGGVAEAIATLPEQWQSFRFRWGPDGYLYYGGPRVGRVLATGGMPEVILNTPGYPDPLPDGRHVLYTPCCSDTASVQVVELGTGETRTLGLRANWARYLPTGHLLLGTSEALRAVAFDARRVAVEGQPFTVLDSVAANGTVESLSLARNGTAVYAVAPGFPRLRSVLTLVDLAGAEQRLPLPEGTYQDPSFSDDGRRIAVLSGAGGVSDTLLVYDLLSGTTTRPATGRVRFPLWTPGGAIIYCGTGPELMSVPADGLGHPDTLYRGDGSIPSGDPALLGCPIPLSLSPDGTQMLLQTSTGDWDLVVASVDTTLGPLTDYLSADWFEGVGRISPDGHWVAYTSGEQGVTDENARTRIFVTSFPKAGQRFPVSDTDGNDATWAPDGRTLYYWRDSTLVAASIQTSPEFAVTRRRDLFTRPSTGDYDVHPDGRRFVMTRPTDTVPFESRIRSSRLVLVVNWLDEFERKAGAVR